MPEAIRIADEILKRFRDIGVANSKTGRKYRYVEDTPEGVRILRETGMQWNINKQHLIKAIEAVKEKPGIYDSGPADLRQYINNRAQSVIWALIKLIPLDTIR